MLAELNVRKSKATEKGVKELEKALKDCEIRV